MKKMAKILLIGIGFGLVAVVLGSLTSKPAPAQVPAPVVPVKVTNTPLPVQGSVNANVTNTVPISGTVNASVTNSVLPVSGAVTATITNTPLPVTGAVTANFSNTSSTPLFADTDGSARSGVAASCVVQLTGAQVSCVVANVPSGKILVIETISCFADAPPGGNAPQMALVVNSTPVSGGLPIQFLYPLALPKVSTTQSRDNYGITTPVRMYAAPPEPPGSSAPSVQLVAEGGSGPNLLAEAGCAISGHLANP